jgi:hypothetical protein
MGKEKKSIDEGIIVIIFSMLRRVRSLVTKE